MFNQNQLDEFVHAISFKNPSSFSPLGIDSRNKLCFGSSVFSSFSRGFNRFEPLPSISYSVSNMTVTISAPFDFISYGKYFRKYTDAVCSIPGVTGAYYFYFDEAGVLRSVLNTSFIADMFLKSAICGLCYYNKDENTLFYANDEFHGVLMPSIVHFRMHLVEGFKHGQGGEISGISDGNETYGEISSALHFDEDIYITSSKSASHRFLYRSGVNGAWKLSDSADNKIALKGNNYALWNEWDGSIWKLTESASDTDYIIYYFLKTNFSGDAGLLKLVGQQTYSSRSTARKALKNELHTIKLEGLPSPEAEFQYAYIAKRNLKLEDDGAGNAVIDLRGVNINSLD